MTGTKKVIMIGILISVIAFLGGRLSLSETNKMKMYPLLSDGFNQPYLPTKADWKCLDMVANNNSEAAITDKLTRISFNAILMRDKMFILVDSKTQPTWDFYLGKGRFSISDREIKVAYQEASEKILKELRNYFPMPDSGLDDNEIEIMFYINGATVGNWKNGVFKLEGEPQEDKPQETKPQETKP